MLFAAVAVGAAAFQLALAAGAPWGHLAMGGAFPGRFPPAMRGAAAVQALVLVLFGVAVMTRAGLMLSDWRAASVRVMPWVLAVSVVSVVLNAVTPSGPERALWLPASLVLAASAIVVTRAR